MCVWGCYVYEVVFMSESIGKNMPEHTLLRSENNLYYELQK